MVGVAGLVYLQAKYPAWLDNLPDSLQDSATGEALRMICDLDLSELPATVPPRGVGRDCPLPTTQAACTGGSADTARAPLRLPRDDHSATRGSLLMDYRKKPKPTQSGRRRH